MRRYADQVLRIYGGSGLRDEEREEGQQKYFALFDGVEDGNYRRELKQLRVVQGLPSFVLRDEGGPWLHGSIDEKPLACPSRQGQVDCRSLHDNLEVDEVVRPFAPPVRSLHAVSGRF